MAKRGALTHRKIRRLAKILGIDPCDALGVFEALLHVTAEQAYRGDIGRMSNADIAEEMFTSRDPDSLMKAFLDAGLLERHEQYRLVVHDWSDHADDATRKKLNRNGEKFWNGDPPYKPKGETRPADGETCPDNGETCTDDGCLPVPEPVPEPVVLSIVEAEPQRVAFPEWFGTFKATYPKRNGNQNWPIAEKKLKQLFKNGTDPAEVLAGAQRFKGWAESNRKVGTEFVPMASTWVNAERWKDDLPEAQGQWI